MLRVGLENLVHSPKLADRWGRCGLVCNQASVTKDLQYAWQVCRTLLGTRLVALFGPQHGFFGTVQDNMIETAHAYQSGTGLPIYSLYSETREPTDEMLSGLDTLVVDLQIVGCRIYTWKSTIAGCLRAAKRTGKRVVILDRPNPVNGEVIEGRVLDSDAKSFVGQFEIPMRHGLTAGEAARLFNLEIGAELDVVPLTGWDPASYWDDLKRPWVLTSPNLPTPDAVYVYPGTVLFEGANFSEGRGTGLPFQLIGAPYIEDSKDFVARVLDLLSTTATGVGGLFLREAAFQPTSQKWAGVTCQGLQLHVLDYRQIRSFTVALAIIRAMIEMGGDQFGWKEPPYEYDLQTLPMKIIFGSHLVESKFRAADFDLNDMFWHAGHGAYLKRIEPILLYKRNRFESHS